MKTYQQFFAELKRRHVFRVAGIYGIVAFGVLQAADLMLPRLGVPDWTVTFMVALVVLAFPVVLIIAWAFEVTPGGVKRTDDPEPGELEGIAAAPPAQRWPAGVLALVGVVALVASAWWVGRRSSDSDAASTGAARTESVRLAFADPDEDGRPSIAVLPFADMSPAADQEYFSDGMTEEILNVLAKVRELRVSARTSAFAFKDRDLTAEQLGDTLRVRYLIEGSVRKAGNRLRITAQLIDTRDGSHLWSESYDRELEDVFAIQTEIAGAIAEQLRVPLGLDGGALVTPTADLAAYDLYLAGRSKMRLRGENLREAIPLFEAAIARDSGWAPAWAALAEATELKIWHSNAFDVDTLERTAFVDSAQAQAERAARRALELDPRNASALVALGSVQRNRAEWGAAEESYRRAMALDPDDPEVHHQYADLMNNTGRIAEAMRAAERAYALDPAPIRSETLAWTLGLDGRPEEAADVYVRALEGAPSAARERLLQHGIEAQIAAGRVEVALQWIHELEMLQADFDSVAWNAARPVAEGILRAIVAGDVSETPPGLSLSPDLWMMAGEPDSAVAALVKGAPGRPFGRVAEAWEPRMDPVRSDPRVEAFLAERGLAGVQVRRTPVAERRRPLVLQGPRDEAGP